MTINACANTSGTITLHLLLIGKAKNLRCFHNINKEALSVVKQVLGLTVIFSRIVFFKCFVPETKQKLRELGPEEREILFLNNCSGHPSLDELISADGKITTNFLSPNVTAPIQPTNQGVLKSIKTVYRKLILRDLVAQ